MTPLEAYKIHVAVKNHFWGKYNQKKYPNMFKNRYKYGRALNIPNRIFESKQGMVGMFKMICDKYKKEEFIALSVANAAAGDTKCGMPFGIESNQTFKEWEIRRDRISYTFEQDLETIINSDRKLMGSNKDHPVEIRLLLGKHIAIESVVILDQILPFIDDYIGDLIIGDTCLLVKRYEPFVMSNTSLLADKHKSLINKIARTRNSSNTTQIQCNTT
jgi:hypothetical protein|tara:strand:+ start:1062 stop:1712 length:651 start_codon:yes stop_codon:yes gene_type:complete